MFPEQPSADRPQPTSQDGQGQPPQTPDLGVGAAGPYPPAYTDPETPGYIPQAQRLREDNQPPAPGYRVSPPIGPGGAPQPTPPGPLAPAPPQNAPQGVAPVYVVMQRPQSHLTRSLILATVSVALVVTLLSAVLVAIRVGNVIVSLTPTPTPTLDVVQPIPEDTATPTVTPVALPGGATTQFSEARPGPCGDEPQYWRADHTAQNTCSATALTMDQYDSTGFASFSEDRFAPAQYRFPSSYQVSVTVADGNSIAGVLVLGNQDEGVGLTLNAYGFWSIDTYADVNGGSQSNLAGGDVNNAPAYFPSVLTVVVTPETLAFFVNQTEVYTTVPSSSVTQYLALINATGDGSQGSVFSSTFDHFTLVS